MTRSRKGTLGHIIQSLVPKVFLLEAFLTDDHTVSV